MARRTEIFCLVVTLVACGGSEKRAPPAQMPVADAPAPPPVPPAAPDAATPASSSLVPRDQPIRGFVYLTRARLYPTAAAARAEGAASVEGDDGVAFAAISDQGDAIEVETLGGHGHCSAPGPGRPVEPTLAASLALRGFVHRSKLSPLLTTATSSTADDGTAYAASAGTPVTVDPQRGLVIASAPFFVPVEPARVGLSYGAWTPPSLASSASASFTVAQHDVVLPPLSLLGHRTELAIDPVSYPDGSPLRCAGRRCLFTAPCWLAIFDHGGTKRQERGGVGFGGRGPVLAVVKAGAMVWFADGQPAGTTRVATRLRGTELAPQGALGGRRCFAQSLVAGGVCFDHLDLTK